ncbi:hypothetical protein E1287_27295 [Actinomadura sp. KC06]|uniref:WbqC family protein n=1 Tax=Actinomadura sp. KC06 TaxID=2530369 RepID=UPI00104E47DE|nr:WbqC family protein [Actinomadura sp. KC06]TDD31222.1 hypothetical protein E1287_27295 [Actinomadura sp. KC06]
MSTRDGRRILVGHQPAYLPGPGYFSRLLDVPHFLVLDHVQFSQGSWQQRNRVPGPDRAPRWLTVPVRQRFGQPIRDVQISGDRWRRRHWQNLSQSYGSAPFWSAWEPQLRAVYDRPWSHLLPLNLELIRLMLDGFGIEVEIIGSSALAPRGAKTGMLVDLCRRTGSNVLRVGTGAAAYLDTALLDRAGIDVQVASYAADNEGLWEVGSPGLTALELLVHYGPAARARLADGARLTNGSFAEAAHE